MKKYISWLLLPLLFLLSCQKEESVSVETGSLVVYASQNHDVSVQTKASVADMPISIAICEASSGDTVEFFESYEELGTNKVDLAVGEYYIKASTLPGTEALFDNPFYYGVDTVQIKPGYIVEAEVECMLANTKVTVDYSDGMRDYFISCETTVRNSSGSLTFVMNEERAGYYLPEKLYVELDLVNTDGTAYSIVKEISNVKARTHYRLAFSMAERPDSPEAGADFEITVDETTTDIECKLIVPIYTDAINRNLPTIVSSSKSLNIKETNVAEPIASLNSVISAKRGISVLALKLVSPYFNTTHGLPKYIDLKKADNAMITRLQNIGIQGIGDALANDVTINFNALLGKLEMADGKATTHTIGLLVRDDLGQQVEDTILVNVRPNIAVEVKASGWSKFAYVNAVMGSDQGVVVKYKVKGTDAWTVLPIQPSEIKLRGDGSYVLDKQIPISGLTENTSYVYEVVAGEEKPSGGEFTITLDETALVNGDFEQWNGTSPGAAGQNFWACGNTDFADFTTSSTPGHDGSGKAAQLKSEWAGVFGIGAFGAGNLFTGTFNLAIPDGELDLGRPYTSRPIALNGHYKYKPQKVDGYPFLPHIAKEAIDTCHIYIALTTEIIQVRTVSQTVFNKNDPKIIAFAELSKEKSCETSGDGYHEFKIPLVYRDLYTQPTYIVIVCTSSKYGDYFAGAELSTLWIDDFVLDFSGDPLTE